MILPYQILQWGLEKVSQIVIKYADHEIFDTLNLMLTIEIIPARVRKQNR